MLLAGEMFAVVPLRSCPHLVRVQPVPVCGIDCNSPCTECGSVQENWVCLVCYTVSMQTLQQICLWNVTLFEAAACHVIMLPAGSLWPLHQ
jgi:hypothetical protein